MADKNINVIEPQKVYYQKRTQAKLLAAIELVFLFLLLP
jgi:hypothetical protein